MHSRTIGQHIRHVQRLASTLLHDQSKSAGLARQHREPLTSKSIDRSPNCSSLTDTVHAATSIDGVRLVTGYLVGLKLAVEEEVCVEETVSISQCFNLRNLAFNQKHVIALKTAHGIVAFVAERGAHVEWRSWKCSAPIDRVLSTGRAAENSRQDSGTRNNEHDAVVRHNRSPNPENPSST